MLKKAYLEITNVCNLSCAFCPGTKRPPHFLSGEEFSLLAGKLAGNAEYLYFHLMGEPLLHPELGSFLEQAGELGFKLILTTNGTLLPEKAELLLRLRVRNGFVSFFFCMDGSDPEPLGETFPMAPGGWTGARPGIFCTGSSGYADFHSVLITEYR